MSSNYFITRGGFQVLFLNDDALIRIFDQMM